MGRGLGRASHGRWERRPTLFQQALMERFYEVHQQGWGCSMVTSVLVTEARPCRSEQIPDLDTKDGELSP